jgi:hypothetical protein
LIQLQPAEFLPPAVERLYRDFGFLAGLWGGSSRWRFPLRSAVATSRFVPACTVSSACPALLVSDSLSLPLDLFWPVRSGSLIALIDFINRADIRMIQCGRRHYHSLFFKMKERKIANC